MSTLFGLICVTSFINGPLVVVHGLRVGRHCHLRRRSREFLPEVVDHNPKVDVDDGQDDGEDQGDDGHSTSNS